MYFASHSLGEVIKGSETGIFAQNYP